MLSWWKRMQKRMNYRLQNHKKKIIQSMWLLHQKSNGSTPHESHLWNHIHISSASCQHNVSHIPMKLAHMDNEAHPTSRQTPALDLVVIYHPQLDNCLWEKISATSSFPIWIKQSPTDPVVISNFTAAFDITCFKQSPIFWMEAMPVNVTPVGALFLKSLPRRCAIVMWVMEIAAAHDAIIVYS